MSSSKNLRVALAQICPLSGKEGAYPAADADPFEILHANLDDITDNVERAKKQGADVVCFPEYLQGILNEGRQYLSLPSRHLESAIADLARTHSICITGTLVHGTSTSLAGAPDISPFGASRSEAATKQWAGYIHDSQQAMKDTSHLSLVNEAFFFDAEGRRRGTYVKKNLWHPEREYLDPGKDHYPVFDTPWGKAGFLICWDLSHPQAAQDIVKQGADIIFAPAYWLGIDSEPMASKYTNDRDYELKVVQALCWARSFETETVVIHTNPGGSRAEGFMGGSGVWAPLRGKVGGFDGEEVGLKVVDIDLAVLKDGRDTYKIREDADARGGDSRL